MVVRGAASSAQDSRFSSKQKKDMTRMKFPAELDLPVDLTKISWPRMSAWIMARVTELLKGLEDEVLVDTIRFKLQDTNEKCQPKELMYELVPFLGNNTGLFMKELWSLLHSASQNNLGIPEQFIQEEQAEQKRRQEQTEASLARIQASRARQAASPPADKRKRSLSPRGDQRVGSRYDGAHGRDHGRSAARESRGRDADSDRPGHRESGRDAHHDGDRDRRGNAPLARHEHGDRTGPRDRARDEDRRGRDVEYDRNRADRHREAYRGRGGRDRGDDRYRDRERYNQQRTHERRPERGRGDSDVQYRRQGEHHDDVRRPRQGRVERGASVERRNGRDSGAPRSERLRELSKRERSDSPHHESSRKAPRTSPEPKVDVPRPASVDSIDGDSDLIDQIKSREHDAPSPDPSTAAATSDKARLLKDKHKKDKKHKKHKKHKSRDHEVERGAQRSASPDLKELRQKALAAKRRNSVEEKELP